MTSATHPELWPLDALLSALADDRDRAADILLEIRRKLTTVFESRGFSDPQELVDRTVERTARKATEGIDLRHRPFPYFYGIARRIALECSRQQEQQRQQQRQLAELQLEPGSNIPDQRLACFEHCLDRLPQAGSELLWSYFDRRGGQRIAQRRRLAMNMEISELALRLRVHRLRSKLVNCVSACLQSETKTTPEDSRE